MISRTEITAQAVEAIAAKQGKETKILDMRGLVGYTDDIIITTGESALQVRAIADEVKINLKKAGFRILHIEGYEEAGWVLLDFGELIVHVFIAETREFYGLEKLWADAPTSAVA